LQLLVVFVNIRNMDLRFDITERKIAVMTSEELKTYRERMGLSQDELAKQLRVARNTVSRWELGNSKIPEFLELALRSIEWDIELTEIVKSILLEATENEKWVSEEELMEKLNQVPGFWKKVNVFELLKKNLSKSNKSN
jgi:transcriptional regulator with XRE-family HTH domain